MAVLSLVGVLWDLVDCNHCWTLSGLIYSGM